MKKTIITLGAICLAVHAVAGLVAKWDFNNYDPSNPTSDQVLRATVGSDGVACRRGSNRSASDPIGDGTLGSMYVVAPDYAGGDTEATTAAGALAAGNYAIAIPKNYHVKLPIPHSLWGHVWTLKIRFWCPAASSNKWRSFFDVPQDTANPQWGKLLIRNDNKIGGGYFDGKGGNYSKVVSASAWHTITLSAGEKRYDAFLDETTEACYSNPDTCKNRIQNCEYLILNADTYSGGDEGELMYIDYVELYDEASVYEGKAPQYSKAGLTGEWTFPAANPLQATVGRNLENFTYGTLANSVRTDGVVPGDTCVRTGVKSGYKVYHGLPLNSNYSVVMDVRVPAHQSGGYYALFCPNPTYNGDYSATTYFYWNDNVWKMYVAKKAVFQNITYADNTWVRVVVTYTHGGNRVCYMNGVQVDSRAHNTCKVTSDHFWFGIDGTGGDLNTDFSYAAIYDRVLTQAEITELHSRPLAQDSTGAFIPAIAPAGQWATDGNGGFTAVKGSALTATADGGFTWARPSAPASGSATYVMDVTLPASQAAGGTLVKNANGVASGIYGTSSTYNGSFHTTTDASTFINDTYSSTWGYWSENALDRASAHRLAVTWAANGRVHYYVDGRPWGQLFPLNANTAAKPSSTMSFLNGLGAAVTEIRAYDLPLTPDEIAGLGGPAAPVGNAPTVAITASNVPDPLRAMIGTVSFTVAGTQGDGKYVSYAVDWGDGEGEGSTQLVPSGTAKTFTHIYRAPGTYTPTFRAISQNGVVSAPVSATPVTVIAEYFAASDVLLTWPWQQNVYTNRFTIMCEGAYVVNDPDKWSGLEVQYGEDYAQRAPMTRVLSVGNTWIYKAHITVEGRCGEEIPYRLGYYGLPLTFEDAAQNTEGVVKLWSQDEDESFSCAVWGDNQQGAKGGDWDSDVYQNVRAAFRHMVERNVDFGLTTGDMAASANYNSQIVPGVLRATDDILGRTRPYYIAWGNHDTSYPNNKVFFETGGIDEPDYNSSENGNYYLYRGGVLFIFIPQNLMGAAATRTWLETLLATDRARAAKFRIILQHMPMYGEDWPIESGAQNLLAAAKAGGVDAVLSGHVHCYEHIEHDGFAQITNGGLGYLDHSEVIRNNYGADTVMGGHKAVPFLWRRQKSKSETNVLGPAEPVVMGNLMTYGEMRFEGNTFRYIAHGFNADGSYIGVFDDFTLVSKTVAGGGGTPPLPSATCADPASYAEFTTKPVTNAKWAEYKTAVGEEFTYDLEAADAPVVNVSKAEIEKFLVWLNGETGDYRLPTIGELRSAFGAQLRREVSEWSSSVDRNSGRCLILGSPAIAREGTWERACDQPEIGNANCHANYLGFRLATGAAPAEPVDPLAAPLAALADIAEPASAYKWSGGALVDISSEFFNSAASLVYDDPVILTGTGAVVREGDGDLTFNAGFSAPNSTSFTKSGAGTLTVKGAVKGGVCNTMEGWVLDAGAGALALDGATYTGEGVTLKSGDRTARLTGANDFAGALFTASDAGNSVTNFVAAGDAAASIVAKNFYNLSALQVEVATNVTMTLGGEFRAGDATLWVDGVIDMMGFSMSGNLTSYILGAGEARLGWRRSCSNSWTFFGISNICFTTSRPLRESEPNTHNFFLLVGDNRIRLTSTCDFTIPSVDANGIKHGILQLIEEDVPAATLVLDTPYDVEFAPYCTRINEKNSHYYGKWSLIKEGTGTLTLTTPTYGAVTAAGGFIKIAKMPTSGATASEGDGKWQIDGTLPLSLGQCINGAFAPGGTLACTFGAAVPAPGLYTFLRGANLEAGDIIVTHDLDLNQVSAQTVFDETGVSILVSTCAKTAVWTGEGLRANPLDPANWAVTNAGERVVGAVPDANTAVYVSGATAMNVPATDGFVYGELVLGNDVTLTADCDWTGFADATLRDGLLLDLQGHQLTVGSLLGVTSGKATVTDTTTDAEHPGELHIKVPGEAATLNDKVNLTGNLKLVKEGEGTFTSSKTGQYYIGGNEIVEGTMRLTSSGGMNGVYPIGQNTGSFQNQVKVGSGAVLDIGTGLTAWGYHKITLDGGTLMGRTTQPNFRLEVTSDSVIDAVAANGDFGSTNLGGISPTLNGNTLDLKVAAGKTFYVAGATGPGTLKLTAGGWLRFIGAINPADPAARFTLDHSQAVNVAAAIDVKDYYSTYNGNYMEGTAKMRVFGTFSPVGNSFYGCELQDGSTIDLSSRDAAWALTRTNVDTYLKGNGTVTFADNATVTLAMGRRHFGRWTKVVAWDAAPANVATLTFQGETKRQKVQVRADGVYMFEPSLVLIIR